MKQKIRCAILGLGNQACEHLAASIGHPDVEIIAGVDANAEQAQKVKSLFPELSLSFFKSLTELQASSLNIDGLILALPHHAYAPIWQQLTATQLPLLKEKPLGRNFNEARMFVQQAYNAQCHLMTAIQRREHPSYQFLAQYLSEHRIIATEIYAHLHLGKGKVDQQEAQNLGWRSDRAEAGGGALLDAGYHMIDLLQFLVGEFNVISASMWNGAKADNGLEIEDRSWLLARSPSCWIMLDTWVKGLENGHGGYLKSEEILLKHPHGILKANREGVWLNDALIFDSSREWTIAMQKQLTHFANNIKENTWYADVIWDQLPAMRKIEEAYHLSAQY